MTGVETVLQDDPSLTARLDELGEDYPEPELRQPLRVVVDICFR